MTESRHPAVARRWLSDGTRFLVEHLNAIPADAVTEPSTLPGWTRAHVLAHVARNADALTRLVDWARTGVARPMYASATQRAEEIETGARRPLDELRVDVTGTARRLADALDSLTPAESTRLVRTSSGREIPALEIGWLRVREVWLHTLDLDAGAGPQDLPPDLVDALIDDVTGMLSRRDGCPAVRLVPTDRPLGHLLGSRDAGEPAEVMAPAAVLLAWLTGRLPGPAIGTGVPALPPWL